MYDYEYENDVLLFLRLLKFLHTEHPFVLEQIIKDMPYLFVKSSVALNLS